MSDGLLPLIPFDTAAWNVGDPEHPKGRILWLVPNHPFLDHCGANPKVAAAREQYAKFGSASFKVTHYPKFR